MGFLRAVMEPVLLAGLAKSRSAESAQEVISCRAQWSCLQ
jgi:hypothetical protein